MTKREPKVWNKNDPNLPPDAVYVGRPSKWGNPWTHVRSAIDHSTVQVKTRFRAIQEYYDWIHGETALAAQYRADCKRELCGKDLVCWCAPEDCHADILLEIANEVTSSKR